MNTFREYAWSVCAGLMVLLFFGAGAIEYQVYGLTVGTRKQTAAILNHVDRVAGEAQKTMQAVAAASALEGQASTRALEILDQVATLLTTANDTVQRAGQAVTEIQNNADTVTANTGAVLASLNGTADLAKEALAAMEVTARSTSQAAGDLHGLLSGPEVEATLKSVQHMSASMAGTASNLEDASVAMTDTARHVDMYVAKVTKPASVVKRAVTGVGEFGLRVLGDLHIF